MDGNDGTELIRIIIEIIDDIVVANKNDEEQDN